MELRTASLLPGERSMLERLIDRLTDVEHRDVYADWLEENGALPRARSLRATSEFLRKGASNSLTGRVANTDAIWNQLIGHDMLRSMALGGLHRDVCAEWLSLGRIALGLDVKPSERKWNVGESHMWGDPDLAPGEAWPTADDCTFCYRDGPLTPSIDPDAPCKFVGQLEFAELERALCSRALPSNGLLSIFTFAEFDHAELGYTLRFDNSRMRETRLHPDGGEANSRTPFHSMLLTEHLAFPDVSAVESSLTPRTRKALSRLEGDLLAAFDTMPTLHGLLGPLRPTTGEPTLPGPEWERLIVFEVDPENPMRLHLSIESNALKRGDFAATHVSWADFD